jgi:hypothetical protein
VLPAAESDTVEAAVEAGDSWTDPEEVDAMARYVGMALTIVRWWYDRSDLVQTLRVTVWCCTRGQEDKREETEKDDSQMAESLLQPPVEPVTTLGTAIRDNQLHSIS